jgi:hypothetical protein
MTKFHESYHLQYANNISDWFGTDTKERYETNLKTSIEKLTGYGWIDRKVKYVFNEHGFRSEPFDISGNSIVFLGGSSVLGTGLDTQQTFPYRISNALNLKCFNLGLGNGSGCSSFRLAYYWLEKLKPKIVVNLSAMDVRMELLQEKKNETYDYHVLSPSIMFKNNSISRTDESIETPLKEFYKIWTQTDVNLFLLQEKNNLAIEQIARNNSIKIVTLYDQRDFKELHCDFARDLIHYGEESNRKLAERFLELIDRVDQCQGIHT